MKLPIAIQLYSVRDDMKKDFEGTVKKIKELGYDGVEFAGLFGKTGAEVKKICDELDIVPVSAHVPYYDMLKDPYGVLSEYRDLGCKYVAVPYLTEECRPGTDGWNDTVEGIRKIAEVSKELGIQLLYHNHDFEFVKIDGKYALDILYDAIPADLLKTQLDTCWVRVGGEDPACYINKYSGRTPVVHLKDFSGSKGNGPLYKLIGIQDDSEQVENTFELRPVGSGVQDWRAIVDAAESAGAEWVVVEQDEPSMGKSAMECAEMSLSYLKTL